MARFSVATRSTGAGSSTLPVGSLYNSASNSFRIREVGLFNTTTSAVCVALTRLSSRGTVGSGLTEVDLDDRGQVAISTAFDTHTAGTPIAAGDLVRASIGAAIGAGVVWTFANDTGISCAAGTANGIGIYVPTGTGQILDWYMIWDE